MWPFSFRLRLENPSDGCRPILEPRTDVFQTDWEEFARQVGATVGVLQDFVSISDLKKLGDSASHFHKIISEAVAAATQEVTVTARNILRQPVDLGDMIIKKNPV